jgi:Histone methylation protein DOT1
MSIFTDREDRHLVQLAVRYEDRHEKVDWGDIVCAMKYAKKERQVLQRRLSTLKQTHGKKLRDFPLWFYVAPRANERAKQLGTRGPMNQSMRLLLPMPAAQIFNHSPHSLAQSTASSLLISKPALAPSVCTATLMMQVLSPELVPADPDFNVTYSSDSEPTTSVNSTTTAIINTSNPRTVDCIPNPATPSCDTVSPIAQTHSTPVPVTGSLLDAFEQAIAGTTENALDAAHFAIDDIFHTVTRSDVNQHRARQHENVGELTVIGVSTLVNTCNFTERDVFVDVGSGIGNVVTQIALETAVRMCLGVEIRVDIALQGRSLIESYANKYPNTRKVHIYPENICQVDITANIWQQATVLYCHNTLFDGRTLVALEALCCNLHSFRIVILQVPFCHRHSPRCTREFCLLFARRHILKLPVSYHAHNRNFVVYDRVLVQQDQC